MSTYVAVYGTLRSGYGNHFLLGGVECLGTGLTQERFTMLSSGFPVCLRDPEESEDFKTQVVVEVYDLSSHPRPEQVLRRLDNLEGHPDWYKREVIRINMGDEVVEAWMYIMPGTRIDDFPTWFHIKSGDYADVRKH